MKNSGLSIHCHHSILVEYCYDYKERANAIKRDKPLSEQEIRLRLFKILPDEALKDIPLDWQEADQKRHEADQKRHEADQKRHEADQQWQKANRKWQKADRKWSQADKNAFHKKWCGCEYWNGREIVFEEK